MVGCSESSDSSYSTRAEKSEAMRRLAKCVMGIGALFQSLTLGCERRPTVLTASLSPPPTPILSHSDPEAWRKKEPVAGTPGQVTYLNRKWMYWKWHDHLFNSPQVGS